MDPNEREHLLGEPARDKRDSEASAISCQRTLEKLRRAIGRIARRGYKFIEQALLRRKQELLLWFEGRTYWVPKLIGLGVVTSLAVSTAVTDFQEIRLASSLGEEYRIKAPILTLVAALTLAIELIGGRATPRSKAIAYFIRMVGAGTGCWAAWSWLMGETNGKPIPYLLAILPLGIVLMIMMIGQWTVALIARKKE